MLRGVEFLGMKIFPYHKLIKRKNLQKFYRKFAVLSRAYEEDSIDYDKIYDFMESWQAYAKQANIYKLRKKIFQQFEENFAGEISTKEVNRNLSRRREK